MEESELINASSFEAVGKVVQLKLFFLLTAIATVLPLTLKLYLEYLAYLALGPGGTPASLDGFLRVKLLGLFAVRDPYKPRPVTGAVDRGSGYLRASLPVRSGPRPEVRGIAPQRQVTQKSDKIIFLKLATEIEHMAATSDTLSVGTSCFERHGTGLFFESSATTIVSHTRHKCKHEVCHVHGSDGSMHMTLHPSDAKLVLEAHWGERHPLSRGGRFEKFVPIDFVMVYSARDEVEVEVVLRIIKAAAWFVGGQNEEVEGAEQGNIGYPSVDSGGH
jgi:hypothetical protein